MITTYRSWWFTGQKAAALRDGFCPTVRPQPDRGEIQTVHRTVRTSPLLSSRFLLQVPFGTFAGIILDSQASTGRLNHRPPKSPKTFRASFALWQATMHRNQPQGCFLNLPVGVAPLDPPARVSPSAHLSPPSVCNSRNHPPDNSCYPKRTG